LLMRLKKVLKSDNINHMKKLIIFLVCAVLLIGAARVISLRYQDNPEDFSKVQEWINIGKEKAEEVTDRFSTQIAEQKWNWEGDYDIDTESWFNDEAVTYSGSEKYRKLSSGQVSHFLLQSAGCKVVIEMTEESDFYFSFENMKKVQAYQKENSLFVKAVRDTLINEEDEKNVLTIYIPNDCVLESAELELGAGGMQAQELHAQEVEISVEAGKMTLDALEADELAVSLGAGAVSLKDVIVHDAEISVGAGSMSMAGRVTGEVEADCAMGSLEMNLQGNVKNFNYELQCVAGTIRLNGEKYSGINEGMVIDNAASKFMELDCAMGSMKITFEE